MMTEFRTEEAFTLQARYLVFNQVKLKFHIDQVKLPADDRPLDEQIADDDKYYPFFRDCIGAIDGTLEAKQAVAFFPESLKATSPRTCLESVHSTFNLVMFIQKYS
jgi:hypothetical protein